MSLTLLFLMAMSTGSFLPECALVPSTLDVRRGTLRQKPQGHEYSWTASITRHVKCGQAREALGVYEEMLKCGVKPSSYTYVSVLKACNSLKDLESAKRIHAQVVESGLELDVYVGTKLVDVYAKCGSLVDARNVFDKMPQRNVVSWTVLILAYAQTGDGKQALQLYRRMQQDGVLPDDRAFVGALKACSSLAAPEEGNKADRPLVISQCLEDVRAIHKDIVEGKSEPDVFVRTMLVDAYAKCGSLVDARSVFEKIPGRDLVAWNAMILGYAQLDEGEMALELYTRLKLEGMVPNERTFVGALKACSSLVASGERKRTDRHHVRILQQVRAIHTDVVKTERETDVFVGNMLVDLYAKCGSLMDAKHVFDRLPQRNVVSWTAMILAYTQNQEGEVALRLYAQMQQEGVVPDDRAFVGALKACSVLAAYEKGNACGGALVKERSLEQVKAIHLDIMTRQFESDVFVGTMLLDVYAKCGSLVDARDVFEKMPHRNVVAWNAMILGYAHMERGDSALELYRLMQLEGLVPNERTFIGVLKACSTLTPSEEESNGTHNSVQTCFLEQVRAIHSEIVQHGCESDVFVGNMLVDVFAKSGSLKDARHVFEKMPRRDVVSWNAMILGCAQMGHGDEALQLYAQMQQEGVELNVRTFVSALKACSALAALEEGDEGDGKHVKKRCLELVRTIHMDVLKARCESDAFVGNMLVDVYARCGSLVDARNVFEEMPHRSVVSWTSIILAYAQLEEGEVALQLYARMKHEGVVPDQRALVAALKGCIAGLASLEEGNDSDEEQVKNRCLQQVRVIHSDIVKEHLESDAFVATMLVDSYAKCGSLVDARHIFEKMPEIDVVCWNAMILGYAQVEDAEEALQLYAKMQQSGVSPNEWTYLSALKACSSLAASEERIETADGKWLKQRCLEKVRAIHSDVVQSGCKSDIYVRNMLVDMFGKCGSLTHARCVFEAMHHRSVVSWTAMMSAYAEMEEGELALQLYAQMQEEGVVPDDRAFVAALKACSTLATIEDGKRINGILMKENCLKQVRALHSDIVKGKFERDVFVGTMLVDVYAKCGSLVDARHVFDKMPRRDVVSWNAMIMGYAQMEQGEEALQLYAQMKLDGVVPDERTLLGALKACSSGGGLGKGKEIHSDIAKLGLDITELFVPNTLIDMYGRCGSMTDAQQVFDALPTRDIVTWSALIAGYARQGKSALAFHLFDRMRQDGIQPNSVTFLNVLTACSHAGLVEKGEEYFQTMTRDYAITPTLEHCICMVDLLGRAGQLEKAMQMVQTTPFPPDATLWRCLLGACLKWNNVELGRQAFQRAVSLDRADPAAYVLMWNIYAAADMWAEAGEIQASRVETGARKQPGQSWWTDRKGRVHAFSVGNPKQPESQDLYANLHYLSGRMQEQGYLTPS